MAAASENGPAPPALSSGPAEDLHSQEQEKEQVVTPWEVAGQDGRIDYEKLIVQFGCRKLDQSLVHRVENITRRPAHPFLRRGVFFAHRYLVLVISLPLFTFFPYCEQNSCAESLFMEDMESFFASIFPVQKTVLCLLM